MHPENAGLMRRARALIALASACAAVFAAFPAQARTDPTMQHKIRSAFTSSKLPVHLGAQAGTAWKRISSLPNSQQGKALLKSLVLKSAGGRAALKNLVSRGKYQGQVQKLLRKAGMNSRGLKAASVLSAAPLLSGNLHPLLSGISQAWNGAPTELKVGTAAAAITLFFAVPAVIDELIIKERRPGPGERTNPNAL